MNNMIMIYNKINGTCSLVMTTCFFLEKIVSKQNPTVFDRHQGLAYLFARKSVNPTVITLYYTYSTFPLNGISYNNYFIPSKPIGADSDYFAYKKLK